MYQTTKKHLKVEPRLLEAKDVHVRWIFPRKMANVQKMFARDPIR